MSAKTIVACVAIALSACDQPLSPSPSPAPSQLSAPAPAAPEIIKIRAGESVRVVLGLQNYEPFDRFGDSYWRRFVYLTSSETVTVEFGAIVDGNTDLVDAISVGTTNASGGQCAPFPRSNTCVIPANTELEVLVTLYPGKGVIYIPGIGPVAHPTFTFFARRIES